MVELTEFTLEHVADFANSMNRTEVVRIIEVVDHRGYIVFVASYQHFLLNKDR